MQEAQAGGIVRVCLVFVCSALFHEGIIVNVPALRETGQLLSIFDQTYAQPNKKTLLVHESQIVE